MASNVSAFSLMDMKSKTGTPRPEGVVATNDPEQKSKKY